MMGELSLVAKATCVLLVALVATRLTRRAAASIRALILTSTFGVLLILPLTELALPSRPVEVTLPQIVSGVASAIPALTADSRSPAPLDSPVRESARGRFRSLVSVRAIVSTVWIIGALIVLMRLSAGLRRLRTLRHTGERWGDSTVEATLRQTTSRRVHVFLHSGIAAPMTCGFVRPAIGLPIEARDWPVVELRQALIHEVEHIRRGDWMVMVLAKVACGFYWFHPLAWMAARRLHLECEYACDDAVVRVSERASYAQQLVSMARRLSERASRPALSMADRRDLARRVVAVLNDERPRTQLRRLTVTVSAIAVLLIAVVVAPWRLVAAQSQVQAVTGTDPQDDISFEVVSIRRNMSGSTGGGGRPSPGGRYTFTNIPFRSVIASAYGVPTDRVLGGPDWVAVDRYDIDAVGKPNPTDAEWAQMLRRLLRDRLGLAARAEQRSFQVYLLVLARADGPAGTGIRRSLVDCWDPEARKKALASAPPGRLACGFRDSEGVFQGGGIQMPTLAQVLRGPAGRPVLDKTGVSGGFDIELKWRSAADSAAGSDGVEIFTAVQEQLGLKLVSDEAQLDVIVIEKIGRPSDN
jgi:uncharacterized protein (TIGR03435 family)